VSRPSTNRLKVNPPLGRMPTLQFCRPTELRIDPAYQRDVTNWPSQTLIRKIATYWNWDLCQPLVVAKRTDFIDRLFVIDGQHRLEAARLRGDIAQLPCVILNFTSVADEAASFVHLNQQRRPLAKLDVFKAALASGDTEATGIAAAMTAAGLSLAPHANCTTWKPGMVQNVGGLEQVWRRHGPAISETAMRVLAQAYAGQVLQYAGTLYPGLAGVCADEMKAGAFEHDRLERFILMVGGRGQAEWRGDAMRARAVNPLLKFATSSEQVLRDAWARTDGREPLPAIKIGADIPPRPQRPASAAGALDGFPGKRWCEQCDGSVTHAEAVTCKSRYCSLKVRA
jgi:hypothetical protein